MGAAFRQDSATVGFALGMSSAVQIAGLAMGIFGATLLGKSRAKARRLTTGPTGFTIRF